MPTQKKHMTRIKGNQQKRGFKGSAAQYITRAVALKKLQISLPEFRKLCILKGIYPREPRVPSKGSDKTYYLKKDIIFLQHDPLLKAFAERKIYKRNLKKAKDKKLKSRLEYLKKNPPKYSLAHIVKERYPTFLDAIRDMDDALSLVVLFSMMPAVDKILASRVENCRKLVMEFVYYVIHTHSLRKVFISIKGIYYQAEILGQTVTWIVPFKFTQKIENNVDYKVMLNFLEFYEIMIGFINFRLFHQLGIAYPPKLDLKALYKGEELAALEGGIKSNNSKINNNDNKKADNNNNSNNNIQKQANPKETPVNDNKEQSKSRLSTLKAMIDNINEDEPDSEGDGEGDELEIVSGSDDEDEEKAENTDVNNESEKTDKNDNDNNDEETFFKNDEVLQMRKQQEVYENLLEKCHFWINRETPKDSLEFIIRSFGGRVSWEGNGFHKDPTITHEFVDRPKLLQEKILTREYIQPQWVYDSINNKMLIPTDEYQPGKKLPPHLSPFVDDESVGYVPDYRKKLQSLYNEKQGITAPQPTAPQIEEESESDEEEIFAEDLAAEKQGKYEIEKPKSKKKNEKDVQKKEEAEQTETAATLLSNRNRKVLHRIQVSRKRKETVRSKLEEKSELLSSGKAIIENNTIIYS